MVTGEGVFKQCLPASGWVENRTREGSVRVAVLAGGPGGDQWGAIGGLEQNIPLPISESLVQMKAELNNSTRHVSGSS